MHEIFNHLHQTRGTSWFQRPDGIASHRIHPLTGRMATANQPGSIEEKCLWTPQAARPDDFDAAGRAVLPEEYAGWLASPQNPLGDLVTCATSASALHVLNPKPGTIYYLDPDLPAASQRIHLRAKAPGTVAWSCGTLTIENQGTQPAIQLRAGRHILTVTDPQTGIRAETWFDVIEM
jgi:penicillin-binding protein 1C